MTRALHGHGMASVNQIWSHCVNQMGKTQSKSLAARHGRGTAGAQYAMCESAFIALPDTDQTPTALAHIAKALQKVALTSCFTRLLAKALRWVLLQYDRNCIIHNWKNLTPRSIHATYVRTYVVYRHMWTWVFTWGQSCQGGLWLPWKLSQKYLKFSSWSKRKEWICACQS